VARSRSLRARFAGAGSSLAFFWLVFVWPALRAVPLSFAEEARAVFLPRGLVAGLAPLSPLLVLAVCFFVAWVLS